MFLVKIKDIFTLRAGPDGLKTGRFKSECADSSDHSFLPKNKGSCRIVKENKDMNKFYFSLVFCLSSAAARCQEWQ